MDPRRVATPAFAPERAERVLAWLTNAAPFARPDAFWGLWVEPQGIGHRFGVGAPPPGARIVLAGEPLVDSPDAGAALAMDRDGFLLYAEREPGESASLADRLGQAGAGPALALPEQVRLAFAVSDQHMGPDAYARPVDLANSVPLLADERPATEILFPDTEPRPYARWRRMQDTRVRYFREGDPTFSQAGGGLRDDPPDAGAPAP